ncbi:MAG TPA: efflux RND transporter periplasmic adaptor subunit, partial [Acidiferrobacteraceae bacterium]|nr:efflux RND transporter periplasmic adaptor subunit [Acidiferrobacteraceae bacterium]HEX20239.1 efflux RND transporter periplasmic adaptor subunit [Acidiferrobacteraceae bacterium]
MNKYLNTLKQYQTPITIAVITLVAGLAGGYWLGAINSPGTTTGTQTTKQAQTGTAKKPLFYRNPMNPSVTSPVPAKDSMGMDYVPVYADGGGDGGPVGTVKIDPVTVQNIGVRIATAEKQTLSRIIRTVGRVDYDEQRLTRLHPKTEGWIEKLYIDKTGQRIRKGGILLSIYSPQLVSSQQEYLLALSNQAELIKSPFKNIRKDANDMVRTARDRLLLLDVPLHQIRNLEKTRRVSKTLHIHSPSKGIVVKIGARKGQYVTPKTELYQLADLSRVWVYVDVYENELAWVRKGDVARMDLAGIPGKTFRGRVSHIYPYAEAKTRTIKVRLHFRNPGMLLKPNMFANVTIHANRKVNAVVVPSEAIVRSGTRPVVFVVRAPGKFEPREVTLGISSDGKTQILKGIDAGEKIVVSSQFLIDSESSLREAIAKMTETNKTKDKDSPGVKQHGDHQGKKQQHGDHQG